MFPSLPVPTNHSTGNLIGDGCTRTSAAGSRIKRVNWNRTIKAQRTSSGLAQL
jgi:hypothetical protein